MERAQLRNALPSETSSTESSAFSQWQRARADSLSEAMGIDPPFQCAIQEQVQPQQPQQQVLPQQQQHVPPQPPVYQQQFAPPQNFGLKVPTLKDMKLPLERFSGEEYEGLGAVFKDWGLRFLDELMVAQVISGGDWPGSLKCGC
ncbi:unnamed protein product [Phytophthora fragariaefolia]|uniref:Unnamed protein product n=1 Tax=Phytophthora fragariaefolia TaxID=1490495 RepID=A0A9W6YQ35_9STRA|nr:unnamed protein product [Phytophthora fragariaefolia]